jgi:hypothetical protein
MRIVWILFRNLIKLLLVLNNYLDHMEDRRDLTSDEQVFASAYKQPWSTNKRSASLLSSLSA